MAFKVLHSPQYGSKQYFYELRDQHARLTDYLYLCSHNAAQQTDRVKRLGITHEVNLTPHLPYTELGINKMRIAVSDISSVLIKRYFQTFIDFVNRARTVGGKVLVYCECGVSRSTTMCIIYLLTVEKMTLYDAFAHIKLRRGIVNPNPGFWQQMVEFEMKTRGANSVKIEQINAR